MNNDFKLHNNTIDVQIKKYNSVTIIGLENGLGTEIVKNLVLYGINMIYLFDNNTIKQENLETGFYYNSSDLGKKRNQVLTEQFKILVPSCNIIPIDDVSEIQESVLVLVNKTPEEIISYEKMFNFKMVCVFSKGVAGMVFVNASELHHITNMTGEKNLPVQIGMVDCNGNVTCAPNTNHYFVDDDIIRFDNLQGDVDCLREKEFKINVISRTQFKITPSEHFKQICFINGSVSLVNKPIIVNHKPFSLQYHDPTFNLSFDSSMMIFNTLFGKEKSNLLLAQTFSFELMPVFSLIGSVTASEVIKLVTNKLQPINQFWCWYEPNLIPKVLYEGSSSISRLYGTKFEKELCDSSWLIVGSCSVGRELIKNLSYIGISNDKGKIYLSDYMKIEEPNLDSQFLLRDEYIKKSKNVNNMFQLMKPINIISMEQTVCRENQHITDFAMKNINGVFNALDNMSGRRYMDEQCFNRNLPLFDCGVLGTKGNTQSVIPFITETYNNSVDSEQSESYPLCVIKNFPNQIHHTIHWAIESFDIFNRMAKNINKWINNNKVFDSDVSNDNTQGKEDVEDFMIKTKITNSYHCIKKAVELFNTNYIENINKILVTYPPNHMTSENTLFWSNGKRMPVASSKIDTENSYHMDYIEATSKLLAKTFKINYDYNQEYIKKVITDNIVDDNLICCQCDDLVPQEFNKDDDIHIQFITSASNLRALNYNIQPISLCETKDIVLKTVSTPITTTSAVSGLVVLEMLKYMLAVNNIIDNKVDTYRSTFFNLCDTKLVYSEPINAGTIELAGVKFNKWDKFKYNENTSLEEFKHFYEKMFKTKLSMILYEQQILCCDFMPNDNMDKMLKTIILEKNPNCIDTVVFTIISEDDDITLPEILVNLN